MRLNQYILQIPTKLIRESLNISDDISHIEPARIMPKQGHIVFVVQSSKPLKTMKGKSMPEVELNTVQKKKRTYKKRKDRGGNGGKTTKE